MNWSVLPWPSDLQGRISVLHREPAAASLGFKCQPRSSTVGKCRRSTSAARSGGARVGPRDNAGAKAQLRRKRRRREDSCSAQMDAAHQGLFCARHSWTRFQPLSREGKVWGTKYKSLLERTRLVPCCWPWLSSGAKLKCNNAVRVWQRGRELKPECEEKHQSRPSRSRWRLFVSLCR